MATFWEIAARSVSNLFSLYFVYLLYIFISRFGFKSGIWILIAPVPVHCFSISFVIYSKQMFTIRTPFGFISVYGLTALLKLEITVCFLCLLLQAVSGSLKRIEYSKQICLIHSLSSECPHCSLRNSFLYFHMKQTNCKRTHPCSLYYRAHVIAY